MHICMIANMLLPNFKTNQVRYMAHLTSNRKPEITFLNNDILRQVTNMAYPAILSPANFDLLVNVMGKSLSSH